MASDLNQVTMTGRLGKDPEVRNVGDSKVANFSIAVGETWKGKDGDRREKTEWVSVTVWGGLANIVDKYLSKGSKVLIQGKFKTRKWQNTEGKDQYTTEVVLEGFDSKLIMLDSKPQDDGRSNGGRREVMEQASERYEQKQEPSFKRELQQMQDDGVPF